MSNTIKSVVDSAIEEQGMTQTVRPYARLIDGVVSALEVRDSQIADALEMKAAEMGADAQDVTDLLVEVGLRPAPEPEAEVSADEEAPAWAKSLIERIEKIEQVAQVAQSRYGLRV